MDSHLANPRSGVITLSWMPFVEVRMKSIRKQVCLGILFLAVMLLAGGNGYCQAVYGSIYGTITDNTGAFIPNAQVTVTYVNKGTRTGEKSNGVGFWRADNRIPGSDRLKGNGWNYGVQGFLLEGTDNRDPVLGIIVINPTLDSISELKVRTQNYDAEFGGAAGGIISASTKSGSNAFHGDAFWFRNSDAQKARDPFSQSSPDPAPARFVPTALATRFGGSL